MCKEFDEEFYKPDRDDEKLFKYLYLIFYMLACKGNYFLKFEDYDGYAQYSAIKIYTRYIKKAKKGIRIKSVLNYAKSCKGPLKVDYQNETFKQVTKEDDEDVLAYSHALKESIQDEYDRENIVFGTTEILQNIPAVLNDIIEDTPYKQDALLCRRLYISCLLSLLNSMTLPNSVIEKMRIKRESKEVQDNYIIKQYQKCREEAPILWNLPSSYKDTVILLVNMARNKISEEINDTVSAYSLPEDVVDSILASVYTERSPDYTGDFE